MYYCNTYLQRITLHDTCLVSSISALSIGIVLKAITNNWVQKRLLVIAYIHLNCLHMSLVFSNV